MTLTSNRDPSGYYYVTCKLLFVKDQSTGINICLVTRFPNAIVLLTSILYVNKAGGYFEHLMGLGLC